LNRIKAIEAQNAARIHEREKNKKYYRNADPAQITTQQEQNSPVRLSGREGEEDAGRRESGASVSVREKESRRRRRKSMSGRGRGRE
jgi:hypothetical protein